MLSWLDEPKIRSLGFVWELPLNLTKEKGVGRFGNFGQMRSLGGGRSKNYQKDGIKFNEMSSESELIDRSRLRTPHGGRLVYLSQVWWLNDGIGE